MFQSLRARIVVILAVVGICGWYLYQNYGELGSVMRLGLDLKGGMQLVLEVDDPDGVLTDEARADAIDRAEVVIRTRVDELGVAEPLIQKVGNYRLIVELAGISDEERAKEIIGTTALLEWMLVRPVADVYQALSRIDRAIVLALGEDSIRALGRAVQAATDATGASLEDLFLGRADSAAEPGDIAAVADTTVPPDSVAADTASAQDTTAAEAEGGALVPFSGALLQGLDVGEFLVPTEDFEIIQGFLEIPEVEAVIPRDVTLRWGWEPYAVGGRTYRRLYVLDRNPFLTGEDLEDAQAQRAVDTNQAVVNFQLSRAGGRDFADITSTNIGNRIAIVLDREVVSAPVVRAQIGSQGRIELGAAPMEEAADLALVLRAGALPAPLRIEEERTVGPSLGQDSVDQGRIAGIVGLLLVVVIMIVYYKVAGALAIAALGVYVVIVMGGLAALDAALTLPGIAGLVLSIGMAVDANVLIFERIREELDAGRAVRTAVDEGFGHALSAILDSNLTTLITALILYQVGTGPVRGFAVTLSIGIIASFFTALYVTRTFLLIHLRGKSATDTLSI
ncbi:MAG: protein translocase subunit SecD [Gemmatimonadota bacterium]